MPEQQAATSALFVGRENELAQLSRLLNVTESGGFLVLVSGPPGIGKSALLNQGALLASRRGFFTVWGRCWEAGGAPPYWPWTQVLRGVLGGASDGKGALPPSLAPILPEISVEPSSALQGDPSAARFRLFDAVADALRQVSEKTPLLVVLDDLHEADEPSLLLLRFLMTSMGVSRVSFLAAFRDPDTEAAPDWTAPPALHDLARQPQVRRIQLGGLSRDEVAAFVVSTTGRDLEQNVVHQLSEETEGNPLFLGELVRLLESEGRLETAGAFDPPGTRIPPTVYEAISRRLRHVSAECRNLLTLAAVLGRDFDLRALAVLAGEPPGGLDTRLDEAIRARLVLEAPVSLTRPRFGHALIRDALYQTVPVEQRRKLHLAAGNALESLYGESIDDHLAELAFHYVASGDATRRDKGIHYARRAAQRAVDQLAFEEGVRLYRLALNTLQELAPSDLDARGDLLLALGDAQARSGDTPAAQRSFLAAAELARRLGRPSMLAGAALGYGGRLVWATPRGDPNLIPLLREALAVVDDEELRCRLLARLSGALREEFDPSERDALSREAVAIARRLDEPSALGYALSARYPAIWGPDNLDERFAVGSELLDVGLRAADKERIFHGHTERLYVELERGQMAAAREDLAGAARIAHELSQPSQLWLVGAIKAELAIFEGRLVEAEKLAYHAHAFGLRAARSSADIAFAMQLLVLRREQGRTDEVAALVQATVGAYAPSYPVLFALEVLARAVAGAHEEASALLANIADRDFDAFPRNDEWLPALTLLAEAASILPGQTRAAEWIYQATRAYEDRNVLGNPELLYGCHSRTLGLLALTLGRVDEAAEHFERALAMNQGWGGRFWAAHSALGLADSLVRRSAEGDRRRASTLLRATLEDAESLSSQRIRSEAERLLAVIGDQPERTLAAQQVDAATVFKREGDYWHIEYARSSVQLKDSLGLRYLGVLLARPGQTIHALDLAAGPSAPSAPHPLLSDEGLRATSAAAPADTLIDAAARDAYRARLDELEDEIDEANSWNDSERAARAVEEKDFLVRELTAALGLGGAPRAAGDPGERARQSVTKAVKSTLRRISREHPELGGHLQATIHTGIYFSYTPDPRLPTRWQTT